MHVSQLFNKQRTVKGPLFGSPQEAKGQWCGESGERKEFVLTLKARIPLFEGYFVAIYKFEDSDGNDLTWFASKDPQTGFAEDQTYRVKATVKRLAVYEGQKQTQIFRLKNLGLMPTAYEPITESVGDSWDAF